MSGTGHITSVAFSENGYSIAAACGGAGAIFDLRKLAKSQVIVKPVMMLMQFTNFVFRRGLVVPLPHYQRPV